MSDEENYDDPNEGSVQGQESDEEDVILDEDQNEDSDADQDAQEEQDEENDNSDVEDEENAEESSTTRPNLAKTKKVINTKKLSKYVAADDNKGVIYLSSVPMFMSPSRLRAMMGQFGEIGSLYLAPEGKNIMFICINTYQARIYKRAERKMEVMEERDGLKVGWNLWTKGLLSVLLNLSMEPLLVARSVASSMTNCGILSTSKMSSGVT